MTALVLRGDARHLPLPDESVDLIVTSPPYFALRSYTDGGEAYGGQIGSEPTPGEYIDNLIESTREWLRVLKPTGSLWVNLGDKYAGSRMDGSSGNGKGGSTLNCLKPGYVPPYHENHPCTQFEARPDGYGDLIAHRRRTHTPLVPYFCPRTAVHNVHPLTKRALSLVLTGRPVGEYTTIWRSLDAGEKEINE
jgi:hypothetical protein